jgi:transcriptional regulator with XRE-family HTH domain
VKAIFDGPALFSACDAIRESRGLTWKQVADEAGVPASTLTRLGQGKHPSVDSLAGIKCWMGISIDRFFRLETS